ncbi:phenol hydroxylase, partial [Pisolithus orientalis]|uniref:phenol hydroxylase n=1 Tax=Pisolithus orientalis TaxID=936130 RepID=UPI00222461D1
AWKPVPVQVLRGWASPSILRTYESKRRKYAIDLTDFDKQYAAMFFSKTRTSDNEDGISPEEVLQAIETASGFVCGTSIHYGPSVIVNTKHQYCAENLVVGQCMLPQVFVHAADARPVDIHDLLPADIRFKILVFLGSIEEESRVVEINALADELSLPAGLLQKYSMGGQTSPMFDLITIVAGKKEKFNYLRVPLVFRPHWSKVLLDDTDVTGRKGGGAYERFGISSKSVTFVIVRPDGYVGMVAP